MIAGRTVKEYRADNEYKMQKQNIEYREHNKEQIQEQKRQPHICEICNGKYTSVHKSRHMRSLKHQQALSSSSSSLKV